MRQLDIKIKDYLFKKIVFLFYIYSLLFHILLKPKGNSLCFASLQSLWRRQDSAGRTDGGATTEAGVEGEHTCISTIVVVAPTIEPRVA